MRTLVWCLLVVFFCVENMAAPKNLQHVLKDFIANSVTLSDATLAANKATLKSEIEEKLINAMRKSDKLFNELYQNIYYTGSFYDGLRIKQADEFDLNIRLRMPFKQEDVTIVDKNVPPGFVKYRVQKKAQEETEKYKMLIKDLMDASQTYLSQPKVNQWLQRVVDNAMRSTPDVFRNFKRSTNGPATTLRVTDTNGNVLDVDLVPVVALTKPPSSIRPNSIPKGILSKDMLVFIVPKPPPEHIMNDNTGTLFRVSIPGVERYLMKDFGCLKPLIKIFKAIRDKYNWTYIASYYIKTMFLFQVEQHPDVNFWKEALLHERFIMMLDVFINVMNGPSLNHYFFNGNNLLAAVSKETAANVKGCLERILREARGDLKKLAKSLGVSKSAIPPNSKPAIQPADPDIYDIAAAQVYKSVQKEKDKSWCTIS